MMKKNKFVSIVIGTFNGEKFLIKQLESIFNQSYKNIEVIVCDDCSNDNTLLILDEYKKKYNFKLIKNDRNLGYIKNFENGLKHASGEFIALSDQDDIFFENKIEQLVNNIGTKSLIYSDAELIDDEDNIIHSSYKEFAKFKLPEEAIMFQRLLLVNFITGCTILFNKKILQTAFPFPSNVPHDHWLALHSALHEGIRFLDTPLIQYRQHNANIYGAPQKKTLTYEIFNLIIKQKRNEKRKKYLLSLSLLDHITGSNGVLKNEHTDFIKNLIRFYNSKRNSSIHFTSFFIVLKFRHIFYLGNNLLKKYLYFLSHLID